MEACEMTSERDAKIYNVIAGKKIVDLIVVRLEFDGRGRYLSSEFCRVSGR